jgi:hypothetical protein
MCINPHTHVTDTHVQNYERAKKIWFSLFRTCFMKRLVRNGREFLFNILIVLIVTGVTWTLNMFWICILFMRRDVEHFFIFMWPFGLLPLEKLFSSFVHFCIGSLSFCGTLDFEFTVC